MASAALAFQDVMFTFRQVITSLLPRQEYREGLFFIISKPFAQTAPNLHSHGQKHVNKGFDSELLRVLSKIPKPVLLCVHCELVWRLICLHVQQRGTSVDARHVSSTLLQATSPHRFWCTNGRRNTFAKMESASTIGVTADFSYCDCTEAAALLGCGTGGSWRKSPSITTNRPPKSASLFCINVKRNRIHHNTSMCIHLEFWNCYTMLSLAPFCVCARERD